MRPKMLLPLVSFFLTISASESFSQAAESVFSRKREFYLSLPLRLTRIQNNFAVLSGVKAGYIFSDHWSGGISIFHHFYFKFSRPTVAVPAITTPSEWPRLFIYSVGPEVSYALSPHRRIRTSMKLYAGWGYIQYENKEVQFKSKPRSYIVLEPGIFEEYRFSKSGSLGIGLAYRSMLGNHSIPYSYKNNNGEIPVNTKLANGLVVCLELKRFF